jgi:hypothetical protein
LIESQSYAAVSVFAENFSGIFFLFLLVVVAPLFRIELFTGKSIGCRRTKGDFTARTMISWYYC